MATIAITGANRGLGLAFTRHYLARGDRVIALCRAPSRAEELGRLAAANAGRLTIGRMDIGDQASIAAGAAVFDEPVDVLINNSGIFPDRQSLEEIEVDAWLDSFRVMTIGPLLVTRAFLSQLGRARGKMAIVSSALGSSAWPGGGNYSYSTAKAACARLGSILAIDLRDRGISTMTLHPGYVSTEMGGPDAPVTPEESAAGCIAAIDALTPATSGCFMAWTGEPQPF